jgi:quercetin dioxygenase-like cupin family protein
MSPVIHEPGQGELHPAGIAEINIKATGEDTNGTFFLSENTIGPGFEGPPLHVHGATVDMFYVLEGTLTVQVGAETRELGPGSFACFKPGDIHTFSNPTKDPVRFLNMNTPSGWEDYMRDLAKASMDGPLTPERIATVAEQHDVRVV